MTNCTCRECIACDKKLLRMFQEATDSRLCRIESTLAEHEEYFKTIEAILTKIQALYEALQDGRL